MAAPVTTDHEVAAGLALADRGDAVVPADPVIDVHDVVVVEAALMVLLELLNRRKFVQLDSDSERHVIVFSWVQFGR